MQKPIIDNSLTGVRSQHVTSCNWTGSADFGRLVPFHVEELDPTVHVKSCRPHIELQMLPLASPTFGKLDLYVHYFFVPTRLLWEGANDYFSRQGPNKNATPPYITPYDLAHFYAQEANAQRGYFKHWTSLGLPSFFVNPKFNVQNEENTKYHLTLLKFRAYQQIWWDFYRDPELLRDDAKFNYLTRSSGRWLPTGTISGLAQQRSLMPRARLIKDSWICNLFAQTGISPVDIPFAYYNPVDPDNPSLPVVNSAEETSLQLRKIEALTRLSERLSLGGKRAIDAMFAAYGVKPNFMKMEMCQYVGGAKSTVLISDITSSADTVVSVGGDSIRGQQGLPLGSKAGSGYSSMHDLNIDFTANEHGYLVGIFSVMPHIHFVQGLNKSWFRNNIEDFFMKSLERTGQVAVSKKEVGYDFGSISYERRNDDFTFAFTQPYYENKNGYDIVAGDFLKYLDASGSDADDNATQQIQYMQSMSLYLPYPHDREFSSENLAADKKSANKIFYYLGGSLFGDVDDHFHVNIDKEVVKDTPYDGYAVPTLETTQDPHKSSSSIGSDTVL